MGGTSTDSAAVIAFLSFLLAACASEPPVPPPGSGAPPPPIRLDLADGAVGRRSGDFVDHAVWDFGDYVKTDPEPALLVNRIAELSLRHDPRVGRALVPLLRHPDESVRIAVMERIGEQKDPKVVGPLRRVFENKDNRRKYRILAAAVEGIVEADAKGQRDFLLTVAKVHLDRSAEVASTALRGYATVFPPTHDTVDDLVWLLQGADCVRSDESEERRAARSAVRPVLVDLLKGVTGQPLEDAKSWKEWWDRNKKTWKWPSGAER